ncbi:MAG: T9SS type A sorting domain-containing protein [Bacteroidales bacterium]|nr:T9SS type A sorting domain-containing protein [Bacteroidales bacterium]MCF6342215.1 T9SS type A sorting domain-containing protein [Bacteroidales bacterium]
MKKAGIAILVMLFGGLSLATAQHGQRNPEIRKYFDEHILPVLETEQQSFYAALSADEMKKIDELKSQLNVQISGRKKGMRGQGRELLQTFLDEATTIAEAHPKEKKHYLKTMNANKDKWVNDIQSIRSETANGSGRGGFAQGSPMFDNFSNPAWLLLWDKERRNLKQPAHMGKHRKGMGKGAAMNTNDMCYGSGKGNEMGRHGGMGNGPRPFRNANPELRAAIGDYARENIIPVIAKERADFDNLLTAEEKDQIALAQGKREARRIMFREWHNSEDFVPGARRNDPGFDMMREDMQKSMARVSAIATAHAAEIQDAVSNIQTHRGEWEREIRKIADGYESGQNNKPAGFAYWRHITGPVQFLMFNPETAGKTTFSGSGPNTMTEVTVFPNPAASYATIRISGLSKQNTEVLLYSKEGGLLQSLYNEPVIGSELSFGFSVADLENGIYIIKVKNGTSIISRKIVVRK